jgi:capsular polysaccharide biosynthesis protein
MELLRRGWLVFKRRWLILVVLLLIAAGGVAAYQLTQHKQYTASTELFLRAPDVKSSASAYQGDLFSRQRAQTYVNMFQSDDLAQTVVDKLGLTTSAQQLASKVSASTIKDTVLITVNATDPSAQRAANIVNTYGSVFADYVAKVENVGSDPAVPPLVTVVKSAAAESAKPTGYPLWVIASVAGGAALVIAIAAMWFLERFDTKVRSRKQVTELTGSSVIGSLPPARSLASGHSVADAFAKSRAFAESARKLSISVDHMLRKIPAVGSPPVVAVASARSGEGKSVVARAIARAYVDRGYAVGLIEADSHAGTISDVLPPEGSSADDSHLMLRAASGIDDTGADDSLDDALKQLRAECDIILLDAPAFADSADAEIAVGVSDAVLVVVRPGYTNTASLQNLASAITVLGTPVAGVVTNRATESPTLVANFA